MKLYCYLIIYILVLLICSNTLAQKDGYCHQSDDVYLAANPGYKYLLLSDRSSYFISEPVYFSVQKLNSLTSKPIKVDEILYVELYNWLGQSVKSQMYWPQNSDVFSGMMNLPDTITSGTYYLRAYTYFDRNFSIDLVPVQIIQVYNPVRAPYHAVPQNTNITARYYVEGGSLICGEENRIVAFNQWENGNLTRVNYPVIVDTKGDTVAVFSERVKGLCIAHLVPNANTGYQLINSVGMVQKMKCDTAGTAISAIEKGDSIIVTLRGKNYPQLRLDIALSNGEIKYQSTLNLADTSRRYAFAKTYLPEGLLIFHLFKHDSLLSQRLFLNKYNNSSSGGSFIQTNKDEYGTREKVSLKLGSFVDSLGQQLQVSVYPKIFSLSQCNNEVFYKVHLNAFLNDWDIFQQLLNESQNLDIKQVNTYLISVDRVSVPGSADDIAPVSSYKHEHNHKFITGKTVCDTTYSCLQQLYFAGTEAFVLQTEADGEGFFSFKLPVPCIGKHDIVIQHLNSSGQVSHVVDNFYAESSSPYRLNYFKLDTNTMEALDMAFLNWQIYSTAVNGFEGANAKQVTPWPGRFYGNPDCITDPDIYIQLKTLGDLLEQISDGGRLRKSGGKSVFKIAGLASNLDLGRNPLLLYNSYPVKGIESLLDLSSNYVDYIEYAQENVIIGEKLYNGVMNVISKHEAPNVEMATNCSRMVLPFFTGEPVLPVKISDLDTRLPQLQNTLYYNPRLPANEANEGFSFYTGDATGEFIIEIKGLTQLGIPFKIRKQITVK